MKLVNLCPVNDLAKTVVDIVIGIKLFIEQLQKLAVPGVVLD